MIPNPKHEHPAKVIRWVDADTVDLDVDLDYRMSGTLRHRLLWLNAPEKNTPAGRIAIVKVNEMAPAGSSVIIRSFKDEGQEDSFGRWLAEVFVPGAMDSVNEYLLRNGYATAYMQPKLIAAAAATHGPAVEVMLRQESLEAWANLTFTAAKLGGAYAEFANAKDAFVATDPYGRSADG